MAPVVREGKSWVMHGSVLLPQVMPAPFATTRREAGRTRVVAGCRNAVGPKTALHGPPWRAIAPARKGDGPRKGGRPVQAPAGPKPTLHGPPWTVIAPAKEGDRPRKGGNTGYVGNPAGRSPPCAARHSSDRRARTAPAEPARRCRKTIMTAAEPPQSATPTAFPKRLQAASREDCRIGVGGRRTAPGPAIAGSTTGHRVVEGSR